MSWWRSATISASREARDLKSPMTTHQISFSISLIRRSIARFAALRQWDLRQGQRRNDWCGRHEILEFAVVKLVATSEVSNPELPLLAHREVEARALHLL